MRIRILIIFILTLSLHSVTAQVKDRFERKNDSDHVENEQMKKEKDSSDPLPRRSTINNGTRTPSIPAESETNFWDRVVYGGNVSLFFGSYTAIYLAPSIGYKVTDRFIVGGGGIYSYVSYKIYNGGQLDTTLKFSMYGPKFFTNYIINDFLYVGAQFEYLKHDIPRYDPSGFVVDFRRGWTPVLFLEAGYTQAVGEKGYIQLGLRYNVLHGPESPYGSSWFPVLGFFF